MYNPVILCITWNFGIFASLTTEHGIEYGSSPCPRKRLVYRMNSCWPGKALSPAVMSTHSVDPEDIRQTRGGKNISRPPPPFLKCVSCDFGIGVVTDAGRELVRRSSQQLGLALLPSISTFAFPTL